VLDEDKGRLRLDKGGVYLEMDTLTGDEAEVQTPLGTVSVADGRCYISCQERNGRQVLSVLVLEGQVEVQDKDGRDVDLAEAGEVIVIEAGAAADKVFPAPLAPGDEDWAAAKEVLRLLSDPEVQDRLKLDGPRRAQLSLATAEDDRQAADLLDILPTLPTADRRQRAREFFTKRAGQMVAVLDAPQQRQFETIHLQHAGVGALVRPGVFQKLGLDPQQVEKIRALLSKDGAAKQALFLHGEGTLLKLGKVLAELHQKQVAKILDLLKPAQKQTWKEMTGHAETAYLPGVFGVGKKGFSFDLLGPQPKTEEQLWDTWLLKTAKQAKMTQPQFARASQLLQKAKKEAAGYRQSKQKDFKQLQMEAADWFKSKKDPQARQAWEQKAEGLHSHIALIGQRWKEDVIELLTAAQRKTLSLVGQKELPQGLGVPPFWEKSTKKAGPGMSKHH